MDHEEITRLTREYGGEWAICHAQRILDSIAAISDTDAYDHEAVWVAAHLHDWGGYPQWIKAGMDHAARSKLVAEDFLSERECPRPLADKILACIEFHHGGPADRCIESILFTDADALDLLGTVGVLRVFSMNYRDLRGAVTAAKRYRDISIAAITLEKSRIIAQQRLVETEQILAKFEEQTGGVY